MPHEPVQLPVGHLACEGCGIAVAGKPSTSVLLGWEKYKDVPHGQEPGAIRLRFGLCPSCTSMREQADAMVKAAPHLAARLGPQVAREHVENTLYGYAVLGRTPPADLALAVARMQIAGGRARYYGPARMTRGVCSPRPWAHVMPGERAAIREAAAHVMRDRLALDQPPVRLQCPTRGCLMCGVSSVTMSALGVVRSGGKQAATLGAWRPVLTDRRALGGRSNQPADGHLCPTCARSRDEVGGIGLSARERALVDHVQRTQGTDAALRLRTRLDSDFPPSLPAWGAFEGSANPQPWAHVTKVLDHL